ncbi:outer membrane beta-barrel protein [Shewanella sp. UCD-KL12]|uniref:outer membrane beta-barrel protein n=1 Tax=Shewanella sp. UCD-KL12 TaxID=1917163 RepID=UPI000970A066|nr:outer membrane beta-barrel protein [Shewanella sp. UCD-KL12]
MSTPTRNKTVIIAALITSAISMPTMAADWFVGGGVGAQQNGYEKEVTGGASIPENSPITSTSEENEFYMIRAGAYLDDNNRMYGTYSYNADDSTSQQSFIISYDYLVPLGSSKLNWFIGASAGGNHVSPEADNMSSGNNFVWGGQTGIIFNITENLSTELGYRYLDQDYSVSNAPDEPVATPKATSEVTTLSATDSQQVYLSVDYRF